MSKKKKLLTNVIVISAIELFIIHFGLFMMNIVTEPVYGNEGSILCTFVTVLIILVLLFRLRSSRSLCLQRQL